ncbi:SixA phosphatase family protein [Azospirillum sp. sgz301742]
MKTLCLMRHAKSGWDNPSLPDHDRPLTSRGVEAAGRVGRHLKQQGIHPDLILCSTARRAAETLALVLNELGRGVPVEHDRGLYLVGAPALLGRLRAAPDSVGTLMMVGHNPDMHHLAQHLAGRGDAAALRAVAEKFSTGACAILTFPVDHWRDVEPGIGTLLEYVRPRALV